MSLTADRSASAGTSEVTVIESGSVARGWVVSPSWTCTVRDGTVRLPLVVTARLYSRCHCCVCGVRLSGPVVRCCTTSKGPSVLATSGSRIRTSGGAAMVRMSFNVSVSPILGRSAMSVRCTAPRLLCCSRGWYGSSLARWGWRGRQRRSIAYATQQQHQNGNLQTTSHAPRLTGVAPVAERTA